MTWQGKNGQILKIGINKSEEILRIKTPVHTSIFLRHGILKKLEKYNYV